MVVKYLRKALCGVFNCESNEQVFFRSRRVKQTIDGKPLPKKLRLIFSDATDKQRVSAIFNPETKNKIDPENFVVKRERDVFNKAILLHRTAFFMDEDSRDVMAMSMAYPVFRAGENKPAYTEIGTSLTRMAGFSSAPAVISAIALKEWWEKHSKGDHEHMIVTEIMPTNAASVHTYATKLGWTPITDKKLTQELHILCNQSISDDDKGRPTIWFAVKQEAIEAMAQTLLDYIDKGYIGNKRTGDRIKIDLSELRDIGLDRHVLQSLARGKKTIGPAPM